ncbi:6,7-dimethyl-8-ribityllumazine synthase [Pontibacter sp. G13]|uniref:6,7-dimethyl-8-ribityllumazine synthase n=1 Tax=Pontibacter sp. G13 TaxID=3074898 RepID=UPI002889F4FC|nr:6,7-dimethyl-8-ribityllumazine synthase [Pontibacter sp. G13]WNJ21188.1 6,7-dimethyl-8-ribityllumazine synthase [Pontibacter sp. G13]
MNQGHDLSHITYEGSGNHASTQVVIAVSKWNTQITEALFQGALRVLEEAGIPASQIIRWDVPGTYELPTAAKMAMVNRPNIDGVICLGCVIQGETRHFDFICQAAAQGIMQVSLDHAKPVIFGVLTPDTDQQALDRAGGKYGNKGEEAAVAFLDMVDVHRMAKS